MSEQQQHERRKYRLCFELWLKRPVPRSAQNAAAAVTQWRRHYAVHLQDTAAQVRADSGAPAWRAETPCVPKHAANVGHAAVGRTCATRRLVA
jgi:hypothetical protein